jgi:biopolymer transport protein ExbB
MHSGGFSLIRLFTSFAMLGAEWVMWVLIALSVASVAVMLERARYYRSLDDDLEKLGEEVRALLRKSAEEAMSGATVRVKLNLERYLAFLGTVGNNAPFVGLFGTVIGIIQAFDKLRAGESAAHDAARRAAQAGGAAAPTLDTGAVMGTLAEALVATAIGLFVAIPAVAAYNYFQRRVKSIVASSDMLAHVVTASLAAAPDAASLRQTATVKEPARTDSAKTKSESAEKKD